MADVLLNYTGAQVNQKLAQIKTEQEIITLVQNNVVNAPVTTHSATSTGLNIYAYKFGRIAFVSILSGTTSAALSANGIFYTLPDAFKPINTVEMVDTYGSAHVRVRILTSGAIDTTTAIASGTYIRCSGCYITAS